MSEDNSNFKFKLTEEVILSGTNITGTIESRCDSLYYPNQYLVRYVTDVPRKEWLLEHELVCIETGLEGYSYVVGCYGRYE